MISRRSKFNLLNEIVFCPRLLLFDPGGWRGAREGRGGERQGEAQVGGERVAFGAGSCRLGLGTDCPVLGGQAGRRQTSPAEPEQRRPWQAPGAWANVGPATSFGTQRPLLAVGSCRPRSARSLRHTLQSGVGGPSSWFGPFGCPLGLLPALPHVGPQPRVRGASAGERGRRVGVGPLPLCVGTWPVGARAGRGHTLMPRGSTGTE